MADDRGEGVVPADEAARGSAGELVVGVAEYRAKGGGEGGLEASASRWHRGVGTGRKVGA